jgi:hypothetical protein
VRELLNGMDSRELSEWLAYYGINPWGPERADLRAGVVAATVANCLSDKGGFKPSDFVPKYGPPQEFAKPKSMEELKAAAMHYVRKPGGK